MTLTKETIDRLRETVQAHGESHAPILVQPHVLTDLLDAAEYGLKEKLEPYANLFCRTGFGPPPQPMYFVTDDATGRPVVSEHRHQWASLIEDNSPGLYCVVCLDEMPADRANALEQSAVVLRSLEWSGEYGMCPTCDQVNAMGHSPDCPIGNALATLDAADSFSGAEHA